MPLSTPRKQPDAYPAHPIYQKGDTVTELQTLAAEAVAKIRANFPDNDLAQQQVFCLAEEAGEFVGAYRRWAGMARRAGRWEDVEAELADVALTASVTAEVLGLVEMVKMDLSSLTPSVSEDPHRQVRVLFRAVADVVEAYDRRFPSQSLLASRLAAVIGVAFATARVLGVDLDAAVEAKAEKIFSRGWRDQPVEPAA
jgi:NTP pyrophosphatase (non-canonical NTP hydrolase)